MGQPKIIPIRGPQLKAANVRSVARSKPSSSKKKLSAPPSASEPVSPHAPAARASQCRRDALTGRWVIFAPGRSERPAEIFETELPIPSGAHCPFCAGNESHTPPATLSIHDPQVDHESWTVRVVPNLFPAVSAERNTDDISELRSAIHAGTPLVSDQDAADFALEGLLAPFEEAELRDLLSTAADLEEIAATQAEDAFGKGSPDHGEDAKGALDNLFEVSDLHGGHEVIVETPNHVESLTALDDLHAGRVFDAYADRMRHWFDVPGVEYVVAFKNVGAAAGASLRHTHSQLIATSLLPPAMAEIGRRVKSYHRHTSKCLLCTMLEGEQADSRRVVMATEKFLVYCPFASRLPYLVRIAPRQHADRFELQSSESLHELSQLAKKVLRSLESMFVSCAYNYTLHTRPRHVASPHSFHWWMEIFPRLTKVAGFEWGSDCYINPVTPEVAASHLRGERCGHHSSGEKSDSVEFSD